MSRILEGISFDSPMKIEFLRDPIVDALGHDARSTYVERFWLPILGPSTTWLLRHFVNELERKPTGCVINITDTARALGLGERSGRQGPFLRSVSRAIDFDMAKLTKPGTIAVRRLLPTLSPRHLAHLPHSLQHEHVEVVKHVSSSLEAMRSRGQQLALTLLELGEGIEEASQQLAAWKFHPALVHQCMLWASREIASRTGRPMKQPAKILRNNIDGVTPLHSTSPQDQNAALALCPN
jgi:hypothetical protein